MAHSKRSARQRRRRTETISNSTKEGKSERGKGSTFTMNSGDQMPWKFASDFCTIMMCKKKQKLKSADSVDSGICDDTLIYIIEEGISSGCSKRVPIVRFELRQNEVIHQELFPKPRSKYEPVHKEVKKDEIASCMKCKVFSSNNKNILETYMASAAAEHNIESSSSNICNAKKIDNKNGTHTYPASKFDTHLQKSISCGRHLIKSFNYPLATKHLLQALQILNKHPVLYPEFHLLREEIVHLIYDVHHRQKSISHSTNIIQMGLRYESKGELTKALKMYTVAFRIRKTMLGQNHSSIPVILNLLGSIQTKRKEYDEAIQIFELALYGKLKNDMSQTETDKCSLNKYALPGTLAVSMKEIAGIMEYWGRLEESLYKYHESLECIMKSSGGTFVTPREGGHDEESSVSSGCTDATSPDSIFDVCVVNATSPSSSSAGSDYSTDSITHKEPEEMEVYLQETVQFGLCTLTEESCSRSNLASYYDSFFSNPKLKNDLIANKKTSLHIATTLHSIANVHRKQKDYILSIASYNAALRGMKLIHGEKHPTVAAVLGNMGNLLKETKKYDEAFAIYQTVLKIESLHLGFSNPEVMITMLNIALIEKCRGNHDNSINLYKEVIKIQVRRKNSFPVNDVNLNLLAVSYTSLGDAQEKNGDLISTIKAYEEALDLRIQVLEQFHVDLGKLFHKLGSLCSSNNELKRADKEFTRALRLYKYNKLEESDSRFVEVQRDIADNRVKISLTQ
mmetsp:Transcript_21105/g.32064  ORF Transcript_21105/g.32064 Transcript_21105/m.32064 type:complete len:739 (+) Transcript_21105:64-2280(+)|eukprot:CAMPEP_0194127578 /NCGR_PEP_ID=MMETSP0150-20130528/60596_1 /TAXON_ID=122233 /ORGANISM="Chaetoceros debilis, Strain MM31A-1" /LENGTH=738 /DNA_ID=CAMNT_0038821513 /DNA_START=58 /DNA_END=2274 /DNA_ORIENTATION=+